MKNQNLTFTEFIDRIEKDIPEHERFYAPRRKQLQPVIDAIQRLLADELDELIIETPPRIGKTTLMLYLAVYLIITHPDERVQYVADRNFLANEFADRVTELMEHISGTTDCPAFSVNTVESCDWLICDEFDTHKDANALVNTETAGKRIWIGSRRSAGDPMGQRLALLRSGKSRWLEVALPALNENGESNYDYLYDVGYDTEYYKKLRKYFCYACDLERWKYVYMCGTGEVS